MTGRAHQLNQACFANTGTKPEKGGLVTSVGQGKDSTKLTACSTVRPWKEVTSAGGVRNSQTGRSVTRTAGMRLSESRRASLIVSRASVAGSCSADQFHRKPDEPQSPGPRVVPADRRVPRRWRSLPGPLSLSYSNGWEPRQQNERAPKRRGESTICCWLSTAPTTR